MILQEPLGKGQCIARTVQPQQDGDAWPRHCGADPLLGGRRALGQVPALHWIKKLQIEAPSSTGGVKPTGQGQS